MVTVAMLAALLIPCAWPDTAQIKPAEQIANFNSALRFFILRIPVSIKHGSGTGCRCRLSLAAQVRRTRRQWIGDSAEALPFSLDETTGEFQMNMTKF
jgi:hypothetical protein